MTRLAITPGEPAGIGPELLVRLAQEPRRSGWIAIADRELIAANAARLGLPLQLDENVDQPTLAAETLTVMHTPAAVSAIPGALDGRNAPYVLNTLRLAAEGCLAGQFHGVVTGPVQKSVLSESGVPFSGHTEFFCEAAGVDDVVMLLVAGTLRVALATTHLPLRAVPDALNGELLERRLGILAEGLAQQFQLETPRILVAGLNPHAGEGGHLGREEIEVIAPVCDRLAKAGMNLRGPLPADTLFTPAYLAQADAVFVMYHDQGLPVLKAQGFGEAVNVTLGLPFVRTSVDHGTALDLAGQGTADPGSFAAALALAERLAGGAAP
ncbi:MAG: 4-hydroxythreonine-4-phosphate dehydrogenase PdxA [Pseudomonadota bacterium]